MTASFIEDRAARAHDLEKQVVEGSMKARRAWINMAAGLHAIRSEGLFELLGYERFTEWIAAPEVSIGGSQAYSLTAIYEELVIERGIDLDRIEHLDPSKVSEVIPAIRKGADPIECLFDAQELSRSDLRMKYRAEAEPDQTPKAICPECGQEVSS